MDPWALLAQRLMPWGSGEYEPCFPAAARAAMDTLSKNERYVLELRCGLLDGKPRTLQEIGQELGITRERVRRIEARALRKLRQPRHGLLEALRR